MDIGHLVSLVILLSFNFQNALQVDGYATLYLKFVNITVSSSSGHCNSFSRPDYCDLYFKLCIGDQNSRGCSILDMRTPKASLMNQNSISFGDFIDYVPNPLSRIVNKLPSKLYMKIEVWDADYSFSDLDDHLTTFEDNAYTYTVFPFETGGSSLFYSYHHHEISRNITQGYITMYVAVWAVCNRGSYGKDCSVSCVPQQRIRHYGCDISTGARVCIPGWSGDECNKIDHCGILTPCGPMGTCTNTHVGYNCACKHNFSGPHCSEPPNQCSPLQDICQNGFCLLKYFDEENRSLSNPIPYCVCIPGFTGKWCELDIDECAMKPNNNDSNESINMNHHITSSCSVNSMCENLYGNFRCFCQNQWTGLRCNTPPTLWPDHYKPIVNSNGLPDFINFKRINLSTVSSKNNNDDLIVIEKTNNSWIYVLISVFIVLCLISCGIIIYCICRRQKRLCGFYRMSWNREPIISKVLFTTKPATSNLSKEPTILCNQTPPTPQRSITKFTFIPRYNVPTQPEKYQSLIYDEIPDCFLQHEKTQLTNDIPIGKSQLSIYEPYSQLEYDTLDMTIETKYTNHQEMLDTTDNVNNQAQRTTYQNSKHLKQGQEVFLGNYMYLEPKQLSI
uniref:Delta-like protein n=2 Tax=Schistosoma mansoni TaxID=6183 RepID=A0A3Q0KFR5_SCHMA